MSLPKSTGIFGIKELWVAKMLTDVEGTAPTYDEPIRVIGVNALTANKKTKEVQSRGDEIVLDTQSILESYDVSWTNEEVPLDVIAMVENAILGTSGTGDTEQNRVTEGFGSTGSYFKLIAKPKTATKGEVKDVAVILYKVRGTLDIAYKGEAYATCSFKGSAIPVRGTINNVVNATKDTIFSAAEIDVTNM